MFRTVQIVILLSFISCLVNGAAFSPPSESSYKNITKSYYSSLRYIQDKSETRYLKQFEDYHFGLVRGFQSTPVSTISYFARQAEFLRYHAKSVTLIEDQEGYSQVETIKNNSDVIIRYLSHLPRNSKVILISHSKGSIDILEALRRLVQRGKKRVDLAGAQNVTERELLSRVKGWISIQGAFGGAPVLEALDRGVRGALEKFAMRWLTGVPKQTVKELSIKGRAEYYLRNKKIMKKILSQVPLISYASRVPFQELPKRFRKIVSRVKKKVRKGDQMMSKNRTDGIIPDWSAVKVHRYFILDERLKANHYLSVAEPAYFAHGKDSHQDIKLLKSLLHMMSRSQKKLLKK